MWGVGNVTGGQNRKTEQNPPDNSYSPGNYCHRLISRYENTNGLITLINITPNSVSKVKAAMNKTSTSRNIHNPDSVHNVSNTQRHTVFDSTDKHTTRTTLVSPSTFDLSFVTTNNVHQSALRILHTVQTYYSIDSTLPNIKVLETIHEAAIFADKNYGIEAAVQWGNGYTIPPSMLHDSVRLFQIYGYNLSSMVTTRLQL